MPEDGKQNGTNKTQMINQVKNNNFKQQIIIVFSYIPSDLLSYHPLFSHDTA
jgi:hypothetical protein